MESNIITTIITITIIITITTTIITITIIITITTIILLSKWKATLYI